ncbi:cytosolic carboxypeptidase-like protein 5 isoform X1 [Argonauta hians]
MEVSVGGLLFTSNFDSGNLGKVERVRRELQSVPIGYGNRLEPDFEFNVWTKPDCSNTVYENGNRSWFYFGVAGAMAGQVIKINIMNMNRQGKLYSQGYCPVIYTVPGSEKWERLQEKPTFDTVDGQFILSFCHRFTKMKGTTTYFAFAYPFSYFESQNCISELEKRFSYCKNISSVEKMSENTVYFYRELLCYSLDKLEVNLLTISSFHNIIDEEEPHFDPKLFPIKTQPRCKKFKGKRVFVVTSRVHPGETPSSFVFNGFLNFILRHDDPRSIQLRKQFVFKLIPILNPDGVMKGHYRTDTRGVNLNRVYGDPSFELNPSIYAAKSIIIYYHVNYGLKKELYKDIKFPSVDMFQDNSDNTTTTPSSNVNCSVTHSSSASTPNSDNYLNSNSKNSNLKLPEIAGVRSSRFKPTPSEMRSLMSFGFKPHTDTLQGFSQNFSSHGFPKRPRSVTSFDRASPRNKTKMPKARTSNLDGQSSGSVSESEESGGSKVMKNNSSGDKKVSKQKSDLHRTDSDLMNYLKYLKISTDPNLNNNTSANANVAKTPLDYRYNEDGSHSRNDISAEDVYHGLYINRSAGSQHLNDSNFRRILPQHSGIAFYIDLHGHASRKGCFIYGNFLETDELQLQNMLYPKLVSMNSAHFEFDACNFTQRNMYSKDKRDGLSKEGSGRVSIHKSIGIIHSYTLECNYNTGKMMNLIAPAHGDKGRASPTPFVGPPPKYTPSIYEDVGQAMAVAALDMYDTNPWSRIPQSEYRSLGNTREWLRKYYLFPKGFFRPKFHKPPLRNHSFSHFSSSRPKLNGTDSFMLNPLPSSSDNLPKHSNSVKKELRPLKEVSSRLVPCAKRCSGGGGGGGGGTSATNNKKGGDSVDCNTQISTSSFSLSNSSNLSSLSSLKTGQHQHQHQHQHQDSSMHPMLYDSSTVHIPKKMSSKFSSSNPGKKFGNPKLQRTKSDISKSSISSSILPKSAKTTSLYDRKNVIKTGLSRSMSSAGDKSRTVHEFCLSHTPSSDSLLRNSGSSNNKHIFKSKLQHHHHHHQQHQQQQQHHQQQQQQRQLTSSVTRIAATPSGEASSSSQRRKNELNSSLSPVRYKSKEKSESPNDVQRNFPLKKKRKYNNSKRKILASHMRTNPCSRNHVKMERRDNPLHEKYPHKRKIASWRTLTHAASQQFSKTDSNSIIGNFPNHGNPVLDTYLP